MPLEKVGSGCESGSFLKALPRSRFSGVVQQSAR